MEHVQVGAVVNMRFKNWDGMIGMSYLHMPFWVFGADNRLIDNLPVLEQLLTIYAQRGRERCY